LDQIAVSEQFPLDLVELGIRQTRGRKQRLTILVTSLADDDVAPAEVLEVVGERAQRADGRIGIPARLVFDPVPLDRPLPEQVFDVDRQLAVRSHGLVEGRSYAHSLAHRPSDREDFPRVVRCCKRDSTSAISVSFFCSIIRPAVQFIRFGVKENLVSPPRLVQYPVRLGFEQFFHPGRNAAGKAKWGLRDMGRLVLRGMNRNRFTQNYGFRQFASVKSDAQAKCWVLPVTSTTPCSIAVAAMMMSASDRG
jgi:hypothetical protein